MAEILIHGGTVLRGELTIQGCKNSVLPILAASLMIPGTTVLHNCPRLSDVEDGLEILRFLGCRVTEGETVSIDATHLQGCAIPQALMERMRSSIIFLGPMLGRLGQARLYLPGGCDLGPRPIDMHLDAMEQLGAQILSKEEFLDCRVRKKLRGVHIRLRFPSVGTTENILLAACLAEGTTIVENAAQEPEIVDLAGFLTACGAKISGAGTSVVTVEGVSRLHPADYRIMADRMAAATYLAAVGGTGGEILIRGICPTTLSAVLDVMEQAGCQVRREPTQIHLTSRRKLRRVDSIVTAPYPLFPTDAQAPVMAMLTCARGTTEFCETIFSNRYRHIAELNRMGADIRICGRCASVRGVPRLHGERVCAEDLRGGAALVTAGLAAEGETRVFGIRHLDRGYEKIEACLCRLGANVTRVE